MEVYNVHSKNDDDNWIHKISKTEPPPTYLQPPDSSASAPSGHEDSDAESDTNHGDNWLHKLFTDGDPDVVSLDGGTVDLDGTAYQQGSSTPSFPSGPSSTSHPLSEGSETHKEEPHFETKDESAVREDEFSFSSPSSSPRTPSSGRS